MSGIEQYFAAIFGAFVGLRTLRLASVPPSNSVDTRRSFRQMIEGGRLVGCRMRKEFIRLDLVEIDAAMVPFGGGVTQ